MLAVAIVGVTDYMLEVSAFMMWVSVLTIALMTLAISMLYAPLGRRVRYHRARGGPAQST